MGMCWPMAFGSTTGAPVGISPCCQWPMGIPQGETRQKNEAVTNILSQGRIVHVKGAGHCVHRDQMSRALKALNVFLGEL